MVESKRLVRPSDVETQQFDWGTLKFLSGPAVTDSDQFSTGIVQVKPDQGHERHTHPDSEEIIYVISGEAEQTVGDEEMTITAGDLVHVPAGVEHSTINTSWETLKVLVVYAPAGPEEVLREHPDSSIVPPGELPDA